MLKKPLVFGPSLTGLLNKTAQMGATLSPEYIDISTRPTAFSNPPRKLLVLDLNGSLLLRTKHVQRNHSNMRTVHPRPYMRSFRDYLFHARVKEWLDTVVWSSAQPHSVADMVDKCFGDRKADFKAIWARDTLGLNKYQYSQKSQTTKDLKKIWSAFPSHSAYTTVLLDDSPRKARQQPWNHLCIHEYDSKMRLKDVEVWKCVNSSSKSSKNALKKGAKKEKKRQKKLVEGGVEATSIPPPTEPSCPHEEKPAEHSAILDLDHNTSYDQTLLAIIGILEALKSQNNVASWIRAGGLSRVEPVPIPKLSSLQLLRSVNSDPDVVAEDEEGKEVNVNEEDEGGAREDRNSETKLLDAHDTWFEHLEMVSAWANRGKAALDRLEIEVDPGVRG
ncbi:hypothetical protein D9758_009428 [Tetrapyrgos nigripes]|uniref:Mitochondrial import inner membrane translocase subunit TIM50 n=1 Tax=Tetrapyrgos nigripes TaxID=182062 RepID=A0A8H5D1Z7_9AGAR|nr:hypothetical protein D9758_009428 [Tetrapyrgos nigripes]